MYAQCRSFGCAFNMCFTIQIGMLFYIRFWLLNNLLETRIKTLETTQMSAHVRENL